MNLIITVKTIDNEVKIIHAEMSLIDNLGAPASTETETGGTKYLYTTNDSLTIDRIFNNPDKVTARVVSNRLVLNVSSATGDYSARAIAEADWKTRCRPALMRAAHTTAFFNA